MKNIEKIRAMSVEELATILGKAMNECTFCHYKNIPECNGNCEKGITKWLNQEDNPMPQIQIGDVIYANLLGKVARIVVLSDIHASNLFGLIVQWRKLENKDILKIERMNDIKEMLETIWRADND